jgi:hypothetical protein
MVEFIAQESFEVRAYWPNSDVAKPYTLIFEAQ